MPRLLAPQNGRPTGDKSRCEDRLGASGGQTLPTPGGGRRCAWRARHYQANVDQGGNIAMQICSIWVRDMP